MRVLSDQRLRVLASPFQGGQRSGIAEIAKGYTDVSQETASPSAQHGGTGEPCRKRGVVKRQ